MISGIRPIVSFLGGQSKVEMLVVMLITPTVVDDDVSVRESLELFIQNEGWHVETFASAQKFLRRPLSRS